MTPTTNSSKSSSTKPTTTLPHQRPHRGRNRLAHTATIGRAFPDHKAERRATSEKYFRRGGIDGNFSCKGILYNCRRREKLPHPFLQPRHDYLPSKAKSEYVKYQTKTLSGVEKQYLATLKAVETTVKKRKNKSHD